MARIFISYAREDLAAAQAFAGALEGAGHDVWWDHQLRAGSRFSWDIAAALRNAEAVVVLWSKHSIESPWVQDEAAEGLEGSRLVPVALDQSKPPLGFRQYHTIDLAGWRNGGTALQQLADVIAAKAAGIAISQPPPLREASPTQPAICVLPFANKSGDPAQDYFSEGITEDVVTDLSKISALSVIGHNTSVGFDGRAVDLKRLANELGVTHVVDGTVRKSASRLRITAQLIATSNGLSLWAERYERELSDVFAIQDEISHAIVEALQLKLLPNEKTAIAEGRTTSAEAYDLYLKARRLWPDGAAGDYRKSEEISRLCAEATAIDPDYANAWALVAMASAELRLWQGQSVDPLAAAERALALDPQLLEPHCVRARHFEELGEDEEAETALGQAFSLDVDSWDANSTAAQLLFRRGKVVAAIPHLEKAVGANRKDHANASLLITCCRAVADDAGARRAAQMAVTWAEAVLICDPAHGSAFASAAHGFAALGECDRARKWIRKALNVDPGNLAMRYSLASTAAAILDDESTAISILEPFVEAARFVPHLRLLELDPSWTSIRNGTVFPAILQRARKRVEALAVSR
ncbi:MAG TPA: TIR domain-containing protein [Sphingomicrobium sp.]|nr:TIR domain-containing protein [Sphingomicrobium sp.]